MGNKILLGLSEHEVWEALAVAFKARHGVEVKTGDKITLHGVTSNVDLAYTVEVDESEHLEAVKKKLVPPAPETEVPRG